MPGTNRPGAAEATADPTAPADIVVGATVRVADVGGGVVVEDFGPLPDSAVVHLGESDHIRPRRYAVARDDDGTIVFADPEHVMLANPAGAMGSNQ